MTTPGMSDNGAWQYRWLPDLSSVQFASTFVFVARWAKARRLWLIERGDLPLDKHGIHCVPSQQTIGRVLVRLDTKAFAACFEQWAESIYQKTDREILALDGITGV